MEKRRKERRGEERRGESQWGWVVEERERERVPADGVELSVASSAVTLLLLLLASL